MNQGFVFFKKLIKNTFATILSIHPRLSEQFYATVCQSFIQKPGSIQKIMEKDPINIVTNLYNPYSLAKDTLNYDRDTYKTLNHEDAVLICTIPKSGTFWIKITISYYLALLEGTYNGQNHMDIQKPYIKNNRNFVLNSQFETLEPTSPFLKTQGINGIYVQHIHENVRYFMGKRLFLYRNPLDQFVSFYYQIILNKNNERKPFLFQSNFKEYLYYFAYSYDLYKKMYVPNIDLVVAYENLKHDAYAEFSRLVSWMGLPIDEDKLRQAIELGDFKRVKSFEDKGDAKVHPQKEGSHARSGEIGQWKTVLTPKHLALAKKILGEHDISLDEFILA